MTDNENSTASEVESSNPPANSKNAMLIGIGLVVIIGGFAGWSLLKSEPEPEPQKPVVTEVKPEPEPIKQEEPKPEPEPEPIVAEVEPEPEPEPEPTPPPPPPKPKLPDLIDSDKPLMSELTSMSWHKDFTALFINEDIIRRFVVYVDNMASGTVAREYASFKPPVGRFKVIETEDETYVDEASYKRYDVYMAVLASASPEDMVALYQKYKPLVKEVYDEIGYPDHDFTDTLIQAIDHVLETPVIEGRIELVSPKVMYDYKNEDWQSLSHVQRQVLRLGGENVKKLKPILQRYRALLANL